MSSSRKMDSKSTTSDPKSILSSLPEACVLGIFKYLDRDGLDAMERVNRRMHSLANRPQFNAVKRHFKQVTICREGVDFDYQIQLVRSQTDIRQISFEEQRKRRNENGAGNHDYCVPSSAVYSLRNFLKTNTTEGVNFVKVCIDRRFIDDCVRALRYSRGKGFCSIKFRYCLFAYNTSARDKEYIIRTLMTLGVSEFIFERSDLDKLIDESTIAAFSRVPLNGKLCLQIIDPLVTERIQASKQIISSIILFHTFIAPHICLRPEWIFELIQMILPTCRSDESRQWRFSLTSDDVLDYMRTIRGETALLQCDQYYRLVHLPTGNYAHIALDQAEDLVPKIAIFFVSGKQNREPRRTALKMMRRG